jgi:hypothetical protein
MSSLLNIDIGTGQDWKSEVEEIVVSCNLRNAQWAILVRGLYILTRLW